MPGSRQMFVSVVVWLFVVFTWAAIALEKVGAQNGWTDGKIYIETDFFNLEEFTVKFCRVLNMLWMKLVFQQSPLCAK